MSALIPKSLRLDAVIDIDAALCRITQPIVLTASDGAATLSSDPDLSLGQIAAYVPPLPLRALGDPSFLAEFGIQYPCLGGSMAHGISSVAMVIAMGKAGMLSFFGIGGVPIPAVKEALNEIQTALGPDGPYGFSLLNNPTDPAHEEALVDLYLAKGVRLVEASAYLRVTAPLVRYRLHGIHRNDDGIVVAPNRIIGKVSRVELAARFFAPAPERLLKKMVTEGAITAEQAELAAEIPVAQNITAEADSGGHTDKRPATALLPQLQALAIELQAEHGFKQPLRVGLAGGIGTPASVASAFSMGAAYVMTGSVNQGCVESGTCDAVRALLAQARPTDVAMAPSATLFEIGGKVQVLKIGTQYALRAAKLHDLYRMYGDIEGIPQAEKDLLEGKLFRKPIQEVWEQTEAFFADRDPKQLEKAKKDPKIKMALLFRAYLGQTSRWANEGNEQRSDDYQIWCGPAMGVFNKWVAGSFLEAPENRTVAAANLNLLHGGAVLLRVKWLETQGIALSQNTRTHKPIPLKELLPLL
jgi:trans-AT polyketide synthase, acyltransferase and oxidoreductase domains